MLRFVNHRRHHGNQHREVRDGEDDLLIAAKERAVGAKPRQHLIGVQEPQRAEDTQEARGLTGQGREKRNDRDGVGPGDGVEKIARAVAADVQTSEKVARTPSPKTMSRISFAIVRGTKEVTVRPPHRDASFASIACS